MRITSKGQVTIPQSIRERMGLLPNTETAFSVERDKVVLSPKGNTRQTIFHDLVMEELGNTSA